ncbi:MAG: BglG family transcription antiterminator [Atopobium sp.]|nr:BglG family transcription antiterminator [Atopobium sp.]
MKACIHRFVQYLQEHACVPANQLAQQFGVSERTIRSYISHANSTLNGAAKIVAKRGQGYSLVISDQAAFSTLLSAYESQTKTEMPQTSKERVSYLLNDLLNRSDWITLDEFSSVLYVSRRTVSDDLKSVEKILKRYHLELVRRPYYGLRVEGREMDRRLCLASLVIGSKNGCPGIGSSEDDQMLSRVYACVDDVIKQENLSISTVALKCVVVHIVVAIKRIHQGCFIPMPANIDNQVFSTHMLKVAKKITEKITTKFHVDFPDSEIAYIAIHLASKETLDNGALTKDTVISEGTWELVNEMLEVIWKDFRFDFKKDIELRMDLACHIVPLTVRLRYCIPVSNPLLQAIKSHMPLTYLMAVDSSSILVKKYNSTLSEDEIGYVALLFALAIERQHTELPKKHALIVCASGMGTARMLAVKVQKEFGQYIDSIATCDVASLSHANLANVDYIFTTVPITIPLSIPICQASLLFNEKSTNDVRHALHKQERQKICEHFSQDLFFSHMKIKDEQEALEFLSKAIERHENLSHDFYDLVMQREALARTSFGNMVAFPHPIRPMGKNTVVAVGLLEKPIDWDGLPVRAIFLSALAEKDDGIRDFDRSMAAFLMNEAAIQTLLNNQSFDCLLSLLTHYSETSSEEPLLEESL